MNSLKKRQSLAVAEMLLCGILWSTAGIFIKLIPWSGLQIAGWRSAIAALCTLVYVLLTRQKVKFTKNTVIAGCLMGLTFLCFVLANKLTTPTNAIVLEFTSPVFLLLMSALLFRRKIRRPDALVVLATLAGMVLFFVEKLETGYMLGNLVALASGLFMGSMYLFIGEADETERFGSLLIGHCITAAVGLPSFFVGGTPEITGTAVFFIVLLGIFQLGIPYILYLRSAKYCSPLACNLLTAVEPLLNPVWVFIFSGEAPGLFALIGGVIVIGSVTVWCIWQARHRQ